VKFKKPVNKIEPGKIAQFGTLNDLDTKKGHNDLIVRTVGYGLQSGHPTWNNEKIRYTSTSKIVEINSANTGGYGLHTSNNPSEAQGEGGACMGDSGGPIFYPEDSNIVVAVVSWGNNNNCVGADYAYRTDTPDAQDFIDGYLD
jgi:secreted trypsin-like serine protease